MSGFYTSIERYGDTIFWRGYEEGRRFSRRIEFQPTLYLTTKKETGWTSLLGSKPLAPKKFATMREAKNFLESYKDVEGVEVAGNVNYVSQFIQEKYPEKLEFNISDINIFYFDIEVDIRDGYADTETADKEILSIASKSSKSDHYHIFGMKDYDPTATITGINPEKIIFRKFATEKAMLRAFLDLWKNDYPDIVTGWNCQFFDIQYLVTRLIRILGEEIAKTISPWGIIRKISKEIFGRNQSSYNISGMEVIDFMDALKKFGYKYGTQESYKLDHIGHVILGEKKLDYSVYGSLTALYDQNPQLYFDYNLKDTHLVERMEEETALLALVLKMAYDSGVNYSEAFGTVGIWESNIYRRLMATKRVPPIKTEGGKELGELVGGYIKDTRPGMYDWVVSFDLNSLYPWLIVQYNLSPETYLKNERVSINIEDVLAENFASDYENVVAANGTCYRRDIKGFIPGIIEEYYAERKQLKQEMLKLESQLEEITSILSTKYGGQLKI